MCDTQSTKGKLTLWLIFCVGILLLLAGCPKKQQTAPPAQTAQQPQTQVTPQVDVQDLSNPRPTGETWVYTDKIEYRIGETIQVEYKVKPGPEGKPWVGLIPIAVAEQDEATNDANDTAYVYVDPAAGDTGQVELQAATAGDYCVRLFGSDSDPAGLCQGQTRSIAIRDWPQGNAIGPRAPYIKLEGEAAVPTDADAPVEPLRMKAGEVLKGTYTLAEAYPKEAWIGLIPWSVRTRGADENDAADVAYTYLDAGQLTGSFEFPLDKAGEYVIRLFPTTQGDPTATFQSVKIIVE